MPETHERSLEIRNYLATSVDILLDGKPLVGVGPNTVTVIGRIPEGPHTYVALVDGQEKARAEVDMTGQTGHFVWTVGDEGTIASIRPLLKVRNYAGDPVEIRVDGRSRITIEPGDSARMTGVPEGNVLVEAYNERGERVAQTTAEMVSGMERIWTIQGPSGPTALLVIHNMTQDSLKVHIDGEFRTKLEPGSKVSYPSVKPGYHKLEAFDWQTGRPVDDFEGELEANTPYDWEVG